MAASVDDNMSINKNDDKQQQMEHPNYNWIDVTPEFFGATKNLQLGELLHDELFGLFEAMSAIEMMDPKMDAGMLCNRGNNKPYTFDQAVELKKIKIDNITSSEIIGIIDSTYSCIVSWLEGHSLAQTVFTNIYLHQPGQIIDKTLRTFCYAVYKIIEIIRDSINRAIVYEEEDFQSITYGYKLQQDITEQKTISMLREVEDELNKKSRIKPTNETNENEYNDALALYSRIRFTKLFYQALSTMGKKDNLIQNTNDCHKFLLNCTEMLRVMIKTVYRGDKFDDKSNHPTVMGFDSMINQRLLPPTFPRYTKIRPRVEALEYIDNLLDRLKFITKITTSNGFHSALDFFLEFSRQSPCILSRSMLQIIYQPMNNKIFGIESFTNILKEAARNFSAPPSLLPKNTLLQNHQAKDCVDTFFHHCTSIFGSLVQLSGHNRARQRDKLAHLLEDFANLHDEAERVDRFLNTLIPKNDGSRLHMACFSTWIMYHTLRVMVMYLLSGFELELYSSHEYHYIFWYLYQFLYGWLVSALTRADSFLAEQDYHNEQQKSKNKKTAKNKKKKITRPYNLEILMCQVLQYLCGGYYKTLVGFRMDGKISLPEEQFDSERVRYEHRLLPFSSLLIPPAADYQKFLDLTVHNEENEGNTSEMEYTTALRHFQRARNMLDCALSMCQDKNSSIVNEINDLLKVAKTNFIVVKLLACGHKKESKEPPVFDFSCHQHFPIIKLV